MALSAAVGFVLVVVVGDRYLRVVGNLDYTRLSLAVLLALAGLSVLFAGVTGLGAFVAASAIGLVPQRFGARRASLMGVLLVPLL